MRPVRYSELWVCFSVPSRAPQPDTLVLSFLESGSEDEYERGLGERFISGRAIIQELREDARKAYLDIVTRVASTPVLRNRTLRECLRGSDGVSRWWYQRLSQKSSVGVRDHYTSFLRLYGVARVAGNFGIETVRIFGASRQFASALKESYRVSLHDATDMGSLVKFPGTILRGLAQRLYFMAYYLYLIFILRNIPVNNFRKFDVGLQGYWDWGITPVAFGELKDRFFVDLPGKLRDKGISVGWIARFSPHFEVWQRKRPLKVIARRLVDYPDVVLIERFLTWRDVVGTALGFRYIAVFFLFSLSGKFRSLFRRDGIDFFPLLKYSLLGSFMGNETFIMNFLLSARRGPV